MRGHLTLGRRKTRRRRTARVSPTRHAEHFDFEARYDLTTIQELFTNRDASTTMICTHLLSRRGLGMRSPVDAVLSRLRGNGGVLGIGPRLVTAVGKGGQG